jgi:gamma-glutamylcyclotransferase (GGCT)/AIG2-like uncharacterized protein YtfP
MVHRCPKAEPVGTAVITDWRLVFRGVADIIPHAGHSVHVALWDITESCERALDAFEGYPSLYIKRDFIFTEHGKSRNGMFYAMNEPRGFSMPWSGYEETLRTGYEAFGIPVEQIDAAIKHAVEAEAAEEQHKRFSYRADQIQLLDRPVPGRSWAPKPAQPTHKPERFWWHDLDR